jgi:glycosyltransferase involved in cell wall biosynthesis
VTFIPDLAPPDARPVPGAAIRARLGLESAFVVGLVGSYNPAPRLGITYGWDLIEALAQTPPEVCALLVGSGDGIAQLETRARELGVLARCRFPGEVPLAQLYEWVGAMDVAISTQTNNDVGAVRTTGKLPIYLACGCPVLATHVGEAARLLGPLGWTVPYRGVVDRGYPARLAEAIRAWSRTPEDAGRRREQALRVCRENFAADLHRGRALEIVDALLDDRG